MKKMISICIVICLLFLTGCGGGLFKPLEKIGSKLDSITADDSYVSIRGADCVTTNGKYAVENGLLRYLDFETMQSMVVCSKPDCRHFSLQDDINSTCNAILDARYLFMYQDNLYFLNNAGEKGLQMELYQAEKDLSKRKKVAEFNFINIDNLILKDGKLYIPGFSPLEQETSEQINSMNNIIGIYSINMDTFKQEKVYAERQEKSAGYMISGIYQDQILYSYVIQNENPEGGVWNTCQLDMVSGEETELFGHDKITYSQMDNQYLYFVLESENILKSMDLKTMKTEEIVKIDNIGSGESGAPEVFVFMQLFDNKIFYYTHDFDKKSSVGDHMYYYDPETKETTKSETAEKFIQSSKEGAINIRYEYKDRFIIVIYRKGVFDEGYNQVHAWITKNDFYAGNMNYTEL